VLPDAAGPGVVEPAVAIARVVQDEIEQDLQAAPVRVGDEVVEVLEGPE
jgi:hypothetical protein